MPAILMLIVYTFALRGRLGLFVRMQTLLPDCDKKVKIRKDKANQESAPCAATPTDKDFKKGGHAFCISMARVAEMVLKKGGGEKKRSSPAI